MSVLQRVVLWAPASALGALFAFLPAIAVGDWLKVLAGGPNALRLGLGLAVWTVLAAVVPLVLASVTVPELVTRNQGRRIVALVAIGAIVAGLAQASVWLSAELRYGASVEADYVGLALILSAALVVLTACTSTALATIGAARAISVAGAGLALLGLLVLGLDSAPGLVDGISPSGGPAVLAFASAGGYAALCAWLLLRTPAREPGVGTVAAS